MKSDIHLNAKLINNIFWIMINKEKLITNLQQFWLWAVNMAIVQ